MSTTKKSKENGAVKATFWGSLAFYLLIVFEMVYMAGPFAAYFYSVYNLALTLFNSSPILSWLTSFFMPHIVRQTTSVFLNVHEIIGAVLAIGGFLFFLIGACKIYYSKFAKKGAVTGGIYTYIRHPQYLSFMVCSFGMLLLWPRFIVLIAFVSEIFIYYLLARAEERECEAKFGQSYMDYKNQTGMFFPKLSVKPQKSILPKSGAKRVLALISVFVLTMAISLSIAFGLQTYSLNSLYAVYTENSANVALCEMEETKINQIMNIVGNDDEVKVLMDTSQNAKYLNYILPSEWYAAEIPMNGVVYRQGHQSPTNYNKNLYKVILTIADVETSNELTGKELLNMVVRRTPIAEVWVNIETNSVTQILDIPKDTIYRDIPVAIY